MLMSEYDDAYVDAMLMVNMQANPRSVIDKTELACSYKKIGRANTDLVGENTALEEKIRGKSSMPLCFLRWISFSFPSSNSLSRSL